MHNFNEKHPHVIENVGCRCKICEESILKYQKGQDVDAIVHDRQAEKHQQVQRKASCRCVGSPKEHLQQRTSSQCRYNSCHKEHLQQRTSSQCRYISYQKSKSLITSPISITVHHKARKRLCNPANWSRACPTKLSRSA